MVKQIGSDSNHTVWLKDNEHLWRYVSLSQLLCYLNGSVFVPSVAKLRQEDPFEGEHYPDITSFNGAFNDRYGAESEELRGWIKRTFCNCHEQRLIKLNELNVADEFYRQHYFNFIHRTRFAWCWFHSSRESAAVFNRPNRSFQAVGRTR